MGQIGENTLKMLTDEATEVFWANARGGANPETWVGAEDKINVNIAKAVRHAFEHALEEGIVELPHPHHSSTYECPDCGSEVDIREAQAL